MRVALSYQQVIHVLNLLKKYYMGSTAQSLFQPHTRCSIVFHQKHGTHIAQKKHLQLIRQLKKIKLPSTIKKKLIKNIRTYASRDPNSQRFVRIICVPLKKDLLVMYKLDKDQQVWIKAGFSIFV